MTLLTAIGFSLALLCPLHAFAFPSVSLFWRVCNVERINSLRSDSPLISASPQSSYFGPLELGQPASAPLLLKAMLLLALGAEVSRAVASESCPDYAIPVRADCPCALPFRPKSSAKETFRDDLLKVGHLFLGESSAARILRRFHFARQSAKPFVSKRHDLVQRLATTTAEPA